MGRRKSRGTEYIKHTLVEVLLHTPSRRFPTVSLLQRYLLVYYEDHHHDEYDFIYSHVHSSVLALHRCMYINCIDLQASMSMINNWGANKPSIACMMWTANANRMVWLAGQMIITTMMALSPPLVVGWSIQLYTCHFLPYTPPLYS